MTRAKRIQSVALTAILGAVLLPATTPAYAQKKNAPTTARKINDRDVDRAMEEIKRYLHQAQKPNGLWPGDEHHRKGGRTALACFALLESGDPPSEAHVKAGLDALLKIEKGDLYLRSMRIMAFSGALVGKTAASPYRDMLKGDVAWLTKNVKTAGGAWGYKGPEKTGDNSCSQFALLALWEAERAGVELSSGLIRAVEKTWIRRQQKDGGWRYAVNAGASTHSMTAAGLASLYLCEYAINVKSGSTPTQKVRAKSWDYLAKNLTGDYSDSGYLAFCVQRIGLASGRKFIGDLDWYAAGAAKIAAPNPKGRQYDKTGKWKYKGVVRASFELIFLARGRIPLTFNKLRYGKETDWNWHFCDVGRFTEHMRRDYETRMRWQVVRLDDHVQRMLDAPILLVSGAGALTFKPEEWSKLREYALRGGTLLFIANKRSAPFIKSVKDQLTTLFSAQAETNGKHYQLQTLTDGDPLYNHFHKIKGGSQKAPLHAVSDGTRHLAVLCEKDIALAWQKKSILRGKPDFDLGVNFFLYATGRNSLMARMRPVFVLDGKEARDRLPVAWLKHNGNSQTQPFALEYLSGRLRESNRVKLDVASAAPITDEALGKAKLAWMTGTESFTLTDAQVAALRKFLDGGGTLFVNSVGGAGAFGTSAKTMLQTVMEGKNAKIGPAAPNSSLMTGRVGDFRGQKIGKLLRSRAFRQKLLTAPDSPLTVYSVDGKIQAVFAPHGIHDTLDGHTALTAMSYMPPSAMSLAENIALTALGAK